MTVFCCVLIIVLGITSLSQADPITTSIGENISTNNLSVAGTLDVTGNAAFSENANIDGSLGIGTASPEELLHIEKDGDAALKIKATTGSGQISGIILQRGTALDDYTDYRIYNAAGDLYIDQTDNGNTSTSMYIQASSGNVGIGTTSPTALLHIKAGSASANTAPLKFTSGPLMTAPEAGAMEYDGASFFLTNASARSTIATTVASIADNAIVRGNGGNGGVQSSSVSINDDGDILMPDDSTVYVNGTGNLIIGNNNGGEFNVGGDESDSLMTAEYNNLRFGWNRDTSTGTQSIIFQGTNNNGTFSYFDVSGDSTSRLARFYAETSAFDGKVGIGTTSPTARLTVNETGTGDIMDIKDNDASVFKIADGGNVTMNARGFTQNAVNPSLRGRVSSLGGASIMAIQGKYAYISGYNDDSLSIVDVSDADYPIEIGSLSDSTNMDGAWAVAVSGRYAYVTGGESDSLAVIDISNPITPVLAGALIDSNMDFPQSVYVSGRYAYVTGVYSDALAIIDISDPTNPTLSGVYTDSTNMDGPVAVYVQGDYAYVVAVVSGSLAIIDIKDPTNPTLAGSGADGTYINGDYAGIYVSGNFAYITGYDSDSLLIVDIHDPSASYITGHIIDAINLDMAISVSVAGRYAYVTARASDALSVIDISDPASPFLAGVYADSTDLNDAWWVAVQGKYAYVGCYAADTLNVLEISGFDLPSANIGALSTSTLDITENARVANNLYVDSTLNAGGGIYAGGVSAIHAYSASTALKVIQSGPGAIVSFANTASATDAAFILNNLGSGNSLVISDEASDATPFVIDSSGRVGIGTTSPTSSAALEISSTTEGFLPPRMTETQRNTIASPAEGLIIYNTTTHKLNFYDGNMWQEVTSAYAPVAP